MVPKLTLELGMNHRLEGQSSTQSQGDFIRSILGWKFATHNLSKDFKWQMSFQVCRGLIFQISVEYSDTWGLGYYQKKGTNKGPGLMDFCFLFFPVIPNVFQGKTWHGAFQKMECPPDVWAFHFSSSTL
jgi:hypothetical protein